MDITGVYKHVHTEKFEEYMKEIGVSLIMRKVGAQVTPTIEIHRNGDLWTIKTLTTFKNTEISFRLGVEFDEVTPDGRKCKCTITMIDERTMLQVQKFPDKTLNIYREFDNDQMKMIFEAPNVKSTRVFKKDPNIKFS